ncbi:MAG: T9SS type A sorting domain-containing protein [Taibaiella sp.]|nr:T9SS type A sorting domain-containing protein [Taibaiella sp.]
MKTITKLLVAGGFLLAALTGQAQERSVDLSLESVNLPADGTVIANGESINFELIVKHNGPDTLMQGDTIAISGGPIPSGQAAAAILSQGIPEGASFTLSSQNPIFTNNRTEPTDETVQWCFTVNTGRAFSTGSPVVDNNAGNNEKCISVTLKGRPTSIFDLNKNVTKVDAFPNPTTGDVSLTLATERAGSIEAVVTDLTGRKLLSQSFQNRPAGENTFTLNLTGFAQGTYLVTLQTPDGKKAVSKVQLK